MAGFIGKCKAALLFNFRWFLRIIFETLQSLLNHWVSRVLIKRGIFGGQLCGFVWLGGFWVEEEESAAWAGLWAATLCYLDGQWGVMLKLITWALPWGVASKQQQAVFSQPASFGVLLKTRVVAQFDCKKTIFSGCFYKIVSWGCCYCSKNMAFLSCHSNEFPMWFALDPF